MISEKPSKFLVVKGLGLLSSESDISSLFRRYASVTGASIIRDKKSGVSRGVSVVEFASIEFASFALQSACSGDGIKLAGNTLKVAYAADNASLHQLITQSVASGARQYSGAAQQPLQIGGAAGVSMGSGAGIYARERPKWPSNFDTCGGSYIFHQPSGYYYEELSGFYYLPKDKVYYCTATGLYYAYDIDSPDCFRRLDSYFPVQSQSTSAAAVQSSLSPTQTDATIVKPSNHAEDISTQQSVGISMTNIGPNVLKATTTKQKPKGSSISISLGGSKNVTSTIDNTKSEDKDTDLLGFGFPDPPGASATDIIGSGGSSLLAQEATVTTSTEITFSKVTSSMSPPAIRPSDCNRNDNQAPSGAPAATESAVGSTSPISAPSTAPAMFICYLCRTKLASAALLARHEKESKLHAENLLKQQRQKESERDSSISSSPLLILKPTESVSHSITHGDIDEGTSKGVYRDRASERRAQSGYSGVASLGLFDKNRGTYQGEANGISQGHFSKSYSNHSDYNSSGIAKPSHLGEDFSNPGNVLLRKMGWSEGSGLGKHGSGIEVPIGVDRSRGSGVGAYIGSTGDSSRGGSLASIVYGSTNDQEYSANLRKAAKARLDELNKLS
jgi:RNA-binding protein 5/10